MKSITRKKRRTGSLTKAKEMRPQKSPVDEDRRSLIFWEGSVGLTPAAAKHPKSGQSEKAE